LLPPPEVCDIDVTGIAETKPRFLELFSRPSKMIRPIIPFKLAHESPQTLRIPIVKKVELLHGSRPHQVTDVDREVRVLESAKEMMKTKTLGDSVFLAIRNQGGANIGLMSFFSTIPSKSPRFNDFDALRVIGAGRK
jgi:hypothetical protein